MTLRIQLELRRTYADITIFPLLGQDQKGSLVTEIE